MRLFHDGFSGSENVDFLRRVICGMLVVLFASILCAGPGLSEAMAKDKVWRIKVQLYTVPGKWDCQWVVPLKFTEFVKERTNGRVLCTVHAAGELVGPREIWTSVSAGTIDAGATLSVYEGGTHPELSFDLGTVYTIPEHNKVMAAGAINPRIAFSYAYRHGADFVIAGMFDFQVETDVKIAIESVRKADNRKRPWQA